MITIPTKKTRLAERFNRLYAYVKSQDYEGYDLFDGLNSRLFQGTPFYRSAFFRLALLQACKRSSVNVRGLIGVPKGFDPSGGAFFMMGHLNMLAATGNVQHAAEARALFHRLMRRKLPREHGAGWGYNWDWQARAFLAPITAPNLISSVYVGKAMLRAYQVFGDDEALNAAVDVARFLLGEMIGFESRDWLCFRYVPGEDAQVHNANLKAAAFIAEVDAVHPLPDARKKVEKAVRFSTSYIGEDGYWAYGTKPFHGWMDNFHTAYNIQSLLTIIGRYGLDEYRETVERVTAYYLRHLFTEDGTPKYYHNRLYPIDCHVLAETLICLTRLPRTDIDYDHARAAQIRARTIDWLAEFQDGSGYFYYLKTARGWNRIPYIRWCQGKMFYALSHVLLAERGAQSAPVAVQSRESIPADRPLVPVN